MTEHRLDHGLPVTPEGRDDLYLAQPADVISWLREVEGDTSWHCAIPVAMTPGGMLMTGADWEAAAVLELLGRPGIRVAVNLDRHDCIDHQLAVADDTAGILHLFDVGEISRDDLDVKP